MMRQMTALRTESGWADHQTKSQPLPPLDAIAEAASASAGFHLMIKAQA